MNNITNALKTLKQFCLDQTDCDLCPMFDGYSCKIMDESPDQWEIDDKYLII